MDPAEESHLRASGAKIGDANRAQWRELLAGRTLADVAWATAAAKTKSRERQVDVAEVAQALKARPPKASAAALAPATVPPRSQADRQLELLKAAEQRDAHEDLEHEPESPIPARSLTAIRGGRSTAYAYLEQLASGPKTQAELRQLTGRSGPTVSVWTTTHADLVEKTMTSRGMLCTLTPKGRASAAALGIEIGATTTLPTRSTPIPEHSGVAVLRPAPASPADDLTPEPTPAPPGHDRAACGTPTPAEHAPTDAIDQVADALDPVEPAPRTDFDSSDLERDLAALFASHVTRNGFAATMRALTRARYLFGIGV